MLQVVVLGDKFQFYIANDEGDVENQFRWWMDVQARWFSHIPLNYFSIPSECK